MQDVLTQINMHTPIFIEYNATIKLKMGGVDNASHSEIKKDLTKKEARFIR